MDAGAEGEMLPGFDTIDDEFVWPRDLFLVSIAGDVPHHHLVAFGDVAAGQFDIVTRGAAHVQHRCVIADDFGNEIRDQLAPRADQPELLGVFDQRHQPAAHGIARGVVATDDQKRDRTDEFALLQVARGFGMRQHRDQIEGPRRIGARFPQFAEIFAHLDQLIETLGFRMHDGIRRVDIGDRDIGPPGQLHSIFPGKIEQGRQHHIREIGRDPLDPIERLIARQRVQHVACALADQRLEIGEIGRCHDRRDGAPLRGVAGRVHSDEIGDLTPRGLIGHLNTAKLRAR